MSNVKEVKLSCVLDARVNCDDEIVKIVGRIALNPFFGLKVKIKDAKKHFTMGTTRIDLITFEIKGREAVTWSYLDLLVNLLDRYVISEQPICKARDVEEGGDWQNL